ncbi:MAG: helix-turn-helix domain-containing protein [Actinomycetota bacterium]|nr:helix-turn-helix domain-containing protein [Actinomycetota bacterium]MDQ3720173.1 helix-turn-helix domain-containing protein [Actinomycetota bacterium]
MPPIGETLRQARMRHELDIADVEARTKIRAKYLRALENEEFAVLPGSTTVRSFIRTYAELLGLDPHVLVEQYRSEHEEVEEPEVQPVAAPARGSERRERREQRPPPPGRNGGPNLLALAGGTLLVVLVMLAVIGLIGGEDEGGKEKARSGAQGTEATRAERPRRRPRRRPRPSRRKVATLNVAPSVPTYVCVDTGPGTEIVFEGTLSSARRFRGRRVRLNLGKTSAKLTANGRAVALEPLPTPVGYDVTPAGVKPLPAGRRPCA